MLPFIWEQKFASNSKYILKQTLAISNIFSLFSTSLRILGLFQCFAETWGFLSFFCYLNYTCVCLCMYKSTCVPIIYLFILLLGSPEERGIRKWKKGVGKGSKSLDGMETYDLPFGMNFIKKYRCFSFLPISPTFMGYTWKGFRKSSNCRSSDEDSEAAV